MILRTEAEEITINGESELFKETEYKDFEVKFKTLTAKEEILLLGYITYDDKSEADFETYNIEKICKSYISSKGLLDKNKKELDLSKFEVVKSIYDYNFDFFNILVNSFAKELEKVKETEEKEKLKKK